MTWALILRDVLDMAIVAFVIYRLMLLIRGTRAVEIIKGLAVLFIASLISDRLGFITINWILRNVMTMVFVALPIVFHPELRRALEQIGRGRFFSQLQGRDLEEVVQDVVKAVFELSSRRWGALIVIERETGLNDYLEDGVSLDSTVSSELLTGIFSPDNPLHDGAVIIRKDRILAASCVLPLSEKARFSSKVGTRHRAAMGLAEDSDALVIVVSEESGVVNLVFNSHMRRYFDEGSLKERLLKELQLRRGSRGVFRYWRQEV